jgi:hypothetical protein
MSLSYTFPFSQALSITRREFFGTMLAAVGTALILGAVFVGGGALEQVTTGWGVNGYFFYLDWVWRSGPSPRVCSTPRARCCCSSSASSDRRSTSGPARSASPSSSWARA